MLLLVLLTLSGAALLTFSAISRAGERPAATRTIVVAEGETLWTLAERYVPSSSPREGVRLLRRVNGLEGVQVRAGQSLRVPR